MAPKNEKETILVYLSINLSQDNLKESPKQFKKLLQWIGKDSIKENQVYSGVISVIHESSYYVALSPYVTARLNLLDVSSNIQLLKKFKQNCFVGLKVTVAITSITKSSHRAIANRLIIENIASGHDHIDFSQNIDIDSVPNYIKAPVYQPGQEVLGIIRYGGCKRVPNPPAISIQLGKNIL